MSAARRAAAYLAARTEPDLARLADDAAWLDWFCLLSRACDRAAAEHDGAPAAAENVDGPAASIARALQYDRALRESAGVILEAAPDVAAALNGPDFAGLGEAIAWAREHSIAELEVPRRFLVMCGESELPASRVLRAAFDDDDDAVLLAAAPPLDIAHLRDARRSEPRGPLRTVLRDAVQSFAAGEEQGRALRFARMLESVRRAGRKKKGIVHAALLACHDYDTRLEAEAVEADAVWDAAKSDVLAARRVRSFCDAMVARPAGSGIAFVPIGSAAVPAPLVR
ncbi:MAG TPA: hypothetical protein VEJ20_07335, partial [Candidatus Eremiobacteraceae bacterium]|nr:hypothetical protein [Candidatus Eremiobacteraceae bacterium]